MVFQNPDASLNPTRSVGDAISRPLDAARRARAAGRAGPRQGAAAGGEPAGELLRPPAARAQRRRETARRHRARLRRRARADPLRRADLVARRLGAGLAHEPAHAAAGEQGTSYVFISHDLSAVQHLSDSIAVVYLGHVMEIGDAVRVLTPPFHPYTEALLSAVPLADPDVKQKPIRLEGTVPSAIDVPSGCRFHTRCPRFLGDICVNRSRPGARARPTTASTATSPWMSWRACRRDTLVVGGGRGGRRLMGRFVLRRLGFMVLTVFLASIIIFWATTVLPGRRGHDGARPLRDRGGEDRAAPRAGARQARAGAVRELARQVRTRRLGAVREYRHGGPARRGRALAQLAHARPSSPSRSTCPSASCWD